MMAILNRSTTLFLGLTMALSATRANAQTPWTDRGYLNVRS
jgi:hypothetical protein